MPEATVNGIRLFYTDAGAGPLMLVLHGGLGFDHTYMKHSLASLEDCIHFYYFDQRNNGRSERGPIEAVNIPQLADDVEGLREHLGVDRIGLIGHSYGGFVALEYATRHPNRVSHLICNDTSPGVFEPTEDELAERRDTSWITPAQQRGLDLFMSAPPSSDDEMRARFPDLAPAYLRYGDTSLLQAFNDEMILDVRTAVQSMMALGGWSVADKLGDITAPTLVLCGRHDLFTTPECSKRLSTAIPNAELVWFEESGHFPEVEEPDAFQAAIRDWIARHP